jgi:NAD(P) transhydrogenase subunit alpha
MGAEFLEVQMEEEGTGIGGYAREMSPAFIAAEMAIFAEQAKNVDIIITTALIPGKPSPTLITEEMVNSMRPGSVIVDLAVEAGGNCALSRPGEVVVHRGVTIIGYMDLPSRLAPMASQLYGSNITHLLADMGGAKSWHIDLEDAVVRAAIILREGELLWPAPRPASPPTPPRQPAKTAPPPAAKAPQKRSAKQTIAALLLGGAFLALVGSVAPPTFVSHLTVFVLACFVGWQVVWNVTAALHTPLMSVTNAISGIIIVGGMLQLNGDLDDPVTLLGAAAVLLASINVAGGFLVTQRMLRMFHR